MSIKLVVLDIAGTTVQDDNNVGTAFQQALQQYGYEVPLEMINPLMGYEKQLAIHTMLKKYEPDQSKVTTSLITAIHKVFVSNMITYYETTDTLRFIPGVEETLAALHEEGIRIAINTGFSRDIAELIVRRLQWREKGLFDYLVASDEVEQGRPFPFMIRRLMAAANVTDSKEVVKVGDTEVDIREGQNAGCLYVIGVTTGAFTRDQLAPYKPTHIIDNLSELIGIIQHS